MQAVETTPPPDVSSSALDGPALEDGKPPPATWTSVLARWLQFLIPRVVGVVFVWAGVQKLMDPTKIIRVLEFDGLTQRIGELRLSVAGAFGLGAFEVVLGALLVLGLWQRRVMMITIVTLLVFSIQLAYLMFAQNPPECGCVTLWKNFRDARSRATSGLIRNAAMAVGLEWTRLRVIRSAVLARESGVAPAATAGESTPPSSADVTSNEAPGTA
jgi:uncharacterized membrane protein YphA (DoxX/SURF4 family)